MKGPGDLMSARANMDRTMPQLSRREFVGMLAMGAGVAGLGPLLLACGSSPSGSTKPNSLTIRAAVPTPLSNATGARLANEFQKEVGARSQGAIQVQIFANGELGTVQSVLDQVQAGTLNMFATGPIYASKYFPDAQVISLPFLFSSYDAFYKAVDGSFGNDYDNVVASKTGLRIGAWSDYSFYAYFNRSHPIATVADLKGLKLRAQPTPVTINTLKALGANAISMDYSEVYTSLQSGAIDGSEAPEANILTSKFYEPAPYISEANQYLSPQVMFINDKWFKGLPADTQTIINDALKAAQATDRQGQVADATAARQMLISKGAKVNTVSPDELAKFKQAVQPVYASIKASSGPDGQKWVDQLVNG